MQPKEVRKWDVLCLITQSCLTLCNHMDCSLAASSVHGDSPGKNTWMGWHALLQGSSQPGDWAQVSCIASRSLTDWTTTCRILTSVKERMIKSKQDFDRAAWSLLMLTIKWEKEEQWVFLCVCVVSHSITSNSLWPHGLQPARLLCPWRFSRQEYWGELPFPPPGDLPDPGIEPGSPSLHHGHDLNWEVNILVCGAKYTVCLSSHV